MGVVVAQAAATGCVAVVVIVKLQTKLCFLPYRCPVCCDVLVVLQLPPSKYLAYEQCQSP